MKKYQVGICDSDIEFTVNLMDSLNGNESGKICCKAFSTLPAIRDYLAADDLDLIITGDISECEMTEDGITFMDVPVWVLSEERKDQSGWTEVNPTVFIYKYGGVTAFYETIIRNLSASKPSSRRMGELIAVYSPVGRSGKTRLARQIAALDEVRGGIYIGMEDFSDRKEALGSKILYLLKIRSPELAGAIEKEVVSEGTYHALYVTGTYMDSRIVLAEDIRFMTDRLLDTGRYSTVVFDIGGAALENLEVLNSFDRIYMPSLEDETSNRKVSCFYELLRSTGQRKLLTKIKSVLLPDAEVGSAELMSAVWGLEDK